MYFAKNAENLRETHGYKKPEPSRTHWFKTREARAGIQEQAHG